MWSPKRVLLLGLGFAVFFGAFAVYAYFLGRFDGLRPLPEQYSPENVRTSGEQEPAPEPKERNEDRKLQVAFGDGCPELKRTIKLDISARRLVLTADQYQLRDDGRVKLWPFSIAIFGKEAGPGQVPEINTVRADEAFLRFDQAITSLAEIGSRKIVGLELRGDPKQHADRGDPGGVTLMNNRRSAQRGNELRLFTPGPVYYEEARQMIWTEAPVEIKDYQSQPEPTKITAIGMDVDLAPENEKQPPPQRGLHRNDLRQRNKAANVGGVDRLHLRSDVEMHLWVDANSGFLGSGKEPAAHAPAPVASPGSAAVSLRPSQPNVPEKAQVVINTQGPFVYDLRTDVARFDILQQHEPRRRPDQVHIYRLQKRQGIYDHLICDHLEIEFRRKPPTAARSGKSSDAPAAAQDPSTSLEMQSAHAWADSDHEVVLTSDAEVLEARGNDLVYDAERRRTTLKGRPKIIVQKDGNQIDAQELELVGMGQKEGQQARIRGPGEIGMLDNATKQRTQHARWKDTLVSTKEGAFDVLVLTGDATFEDLDKEHPQQLQADQLKVWLHPGDDKAIPKPPPVPGNDSQRRRPHHLEAIGNVQARSPEMNVHHTERLIVWFKDVPQPLKPPGGPPPVTAESTHTTGKSTIDGAGPPAPQSTATPPTSAPEST
ncbi:MAG TPA: hypothetical protein VKI65_15465, partial [Gemmataceae bacterium]|nr:hypothetical protein [Gemmataceae bacterium]